MPSDPPQPTRTDDARANNIEAADTADGPDTANPPAADLAHPPELTAPGTAASTETVVGGQAGPLATTHAGPGHDDRSSGHRHLTCLTGRARPHRDLPQQCSTWELPRSLAEQLAKGGYLVATGWDHDAAPPDLAARAITTYSQPGAVVLDPDCGTGTTLVEAIRARRHALGASTDRPWLRTAQANLAAAQRAGAPADAALYTNLALLLEHQPAASADLLITTLRSDYPGPRWRTAALARLFLTLHETAPTLHPGATVIIIASRQRGTPAGIGEPIIALARAVGLQPTACHLARQHIARPRIGQRTRRGRHDKRSTTTSHDVLVFRTPISLRHTSAAPTPTPHPHDGGSPDLDLQRCAA